jgi:hypothetical protein
MPFTPLEIQQVWEKGTIVLDYDSSTWRKDVCTAWISRTEYGNSNSVYGWEIDHIDPNGGDHLKNLRPLQWENKAAKGDSGSCVVVSSSDKNIHIAAP